MRLRSLLSPFAGFWTGLCCALLIWAASSLGLTTHLEGVALDGLFRARGSRDADPRVVIIAVDDATVVRAGAQTGAGWPLPRVYYARAIRELTRAGVRTIAFDVLFSEPGPAHAQDLELAKACLAANRVVQACAFQVPAQVTEIAPHIVAAPLPARFALQQSANSTFSGARRAVWATAPLPALLQSARGLGHVNVFPEASGTLRRAPHLLRWRDQLFPSLALASAAQFLDSTPRIDAKNRCIALDGRQIPLDDDGSTHVNWIGAGGSYPQWSLNQLLDGEIPAAALRGRAVVLGVTALGAYENRATPFAGGVPAIDFQANALDDILSNRILRPAPPLLTTALLFAFSLACALATAQRGGTRLWPIPILFGLLLFAGWGALCRDFYLPVGAPLLSGALACALAAAQGYRREWEAITRFDAATSSLARGTTLLGASLGAVSDAGPATMARDERELVQIIRATALETLGAREVFLIFDDSNLELTGAFKPVQNGVSPAQIAAQKAQQAGQTWIFPRAKTKNSIDSPADPALQILRGQTLIAAPLPTTMRDRTMELAPKRHFQGALVAIGTLNGRPFNERDAKMLETLAEGAALALENFRYAGALQGRIESADRELAGAYRLLSEQSAKLFAAVESIDAALVISNSRGETAFVNAAATGILRAATPELGQSVGHALELGELGEWALWFQNSTGMEAAANPKPGFDSPENPALGATPISIQRPAADDFAANSRNATALHRAGFVPDSTRVSPSLHGEIARGKQHLAAQFTPLWSEYSEFLGAMLVVSDVSAQRELAARKTDFVGFVAHELRTPLTTILGYTSLLETMAGHFSPSETRDMTQTISRHCRRLNAMISDLLDISRLEAGDPLPIRREKFDLLALCNRLVTEQKTYLNPTPPFQFKVCSALSTLTLRGDCDRIEQVVLNLLSNAVKYSPEGGQVTLHLSQNEREIALSVSDEGIGLSRAEIGKMFGKFYRTEDSKARGIKGNGLGLNLVKQIIEAHGGEISVESERENGGKGTTFRVILPTEE